MQLQISYSQMIIKRILTIRDREFRQLAGESSCFKKNFVPERYSRYVSHMANSNISGAQIYIQSRLARVVAV